MGKRSTFLELKESERAYRRDLILDAAMNLFAERPFHQIGMRDIANEAGISPASIYRYFSSRDDILAEILGHQVSEGSQRQQRRLEAGRTSLEDIAAGIVDFFMEKEATLQMLNHFLLKEEVDEEAREKFSSIQSHYLQQFDQVLESMGCDQDNVRLFSRAFFASLLGIIMSFRNSPGNSSENNKKHVHRLAKMTAIIFKKGMP